MKNTAIFSHAHKVARATREAYDTYAAAFRAALAQTYKEIREAALRALGPLPSITTYTVEGSAQKFWLTLFVPLFVAVCGVALAALKPTTAGGAVAVAELSFFGTLLACGLGYLQTVRMTERNFRFLTAR